MDRRAILLVAMASLVAPAKALADDASIDAGTSLTYLHISTSSTGGGKTLSVMGGTARFLYYDGNGKVGLGGKITAFAPAWDDEDDTDNLGFDLQFTAQFSGRWKGDKAHVMPCGGFSVGFRQLFLDTGTPARYTVSGFGIDIHLGVHGYFGKDSGFYWRFSTLLGGHLLFPDPGWTGGVGAELTIGIFID